MSASSAALHLLQRASEVKSGLEAGNAKTRQEISALQEEARAIQSSVSKLNEELRALLDETAASKDASLVDAAENIAAKALLDRKAEGILAALHGSRAATKTAQEERARFFADLNSLCSTAATAVEAETKVRKEALAAKRAAIAESAARTAEAQKAAANAATQADATHEACDAASAALGGLRARLTALRTQAAALPDAFNRARAALDGAEKEEAAAGDRARGTRLRDRDLGKACAAADAEKKALERRLAAAAITAKRAAAAAAKAAAEDAARRSASEEATRASRDKRREGAQPEGGARGTAASAAEPRRKAAAREGAPPPAARATNATPHVNHFAPARVSFEDVLARQDQDGRAQRKGPAPGKK